MRFINKILDNIKQFINNLKNPIVGVESYLSVKYADEYAVGFDIPCKNTEVILPMEKKIIELDLIVNIPSDYWVMLAPRSKTAKPDIPIILSNSIGVIDPNYKKTIKAGVWNLSNYPFTMTKGDCYFQGIIMPRIKGILYDTLVVDDTNRDGFGSTDKK